MRSEARRPRRQCSILQRVRMWLIVDWLLDNWLAWRESWLPLSDGGLAGDEMFPLLTDWLLHVRIKGRGLLPRRCW